MDLRFSIFPPFLLAIKDDDPWQELVEEVNIMEDHVDHDNQIPDLRSQNAALFYLNVS